MSLRNNKNTHPTKYAMMSSCTIRLMIPTDQLFTTTDLVVSYVKKPVTKPHAIDVMAPGVWLLSSLQQVQSGMGDVSP